MIHHILGWYMTSADLLQTKPSQVLAPADMAVWNQPATPKSVPTPHACTDVCQPYRGPILQGRRGETITARCQVCRRWVEPEDLAGGECGRCWDAHDIAFERSQDR